MSVTRPPSSTRSPDKSSRAGRVVPSDAFFSPGSLDVSFASMAPLAFILVGGLLYFQVDGKFAGLTVVR